ncbi:MULTISPECIES: lipopolysaccharide biosynthesis protein [unclassified Haloarcula]|uniref:lipopolysaccharide biosynthesis protein n=1 Tax=unclassified Haloarcula TaxID=2624677 RepID=UPI000A8B87F4|nr:MULTISPECIES: lipopolysaccharide biosynthesis protein [unclassified Haloarcula]
MTRILNWLRSLASRIKTILTPEGGLLEQSVTGGIWLTALNISGRIFQILTLVVLARLLDPRAFGIVGLASLVIVGLRRVSKLGLDDALIYNKDENVDRYLNTVLVMKGVRGLVIGGLVFVAAPLIGQFFSEPALISIVRAMAIGSVVMGFQNPAIVYFKKDLNFHKEFAYEVGAEAVYFIVAFAYALVNPTVWALAFAYIARNVARFGLSYLLHEYRPWPSFDTDLAREMIDYGKWITGSSILNYISNEGDDIFVGWLLGSATLGFYQFAYRLSNAPATEVTHVISRVTFPAYSKIQDDMEALRAGFYRTIRLSTFLVAPMAVGIAVVAEPFVLAFLGEQWLPMVLPMQILAIYGLIRGYIASFGSVWRATGNQDYLVKLQALTIGLIAIPIYPAATEFGIAGVAATVVGVYVFIMVPLDMYLAAAAVEGSLQRLAIEFAYPLPGAAAMAAVVLWVQEMISVIPIVEFAVLVVVGAATYAVSVLLMEAGSEWGIINELRSLVRTI